MSRMTHPPNPRPPRSSRPAPDVHRTDAGEDGEPDGPLIPAVPKPKPRPTLGAGAMELPTQADEKVLASARG